MNSLANAGARLPRADRHPQSRLLLRANPGAQERQYARLRPHGNGLYRPFRLRKIDAPSHFEPDVRPLPEPAGGGRGHVRRGKHPRRGHRLEPAAVAHWHGLPEADPVPDDDLREHRFRRQALREAAQGGAGRARSVGAGEGRALARGEGQAAGERAQPVGRPAAAALHRAHRGAAARGHPARRASLGARPHLHRENRGADRRASRAISPSPS